MIWTKDHMKAIGRLASDHSHRRWENTGYFDVPGAVMRELAQNGYCETRKRGPNQPAEYRSTSSEYWARQKEAKPPT